MIFPSAATTMVRADRGTLVGPATAAPVVILNLAPWQGQLMVPSATTLQVQPTCVQTALNALYWSLTGWVTTTFAAVKTMPPPTGIWDVVPSSVPVAPPPAAAVLVAPPPVIAVPAGALVVAGAGCACAPGTCPSSFAS